MMIYLRWSFAAAFSLLTFLSWRASAYPVGPAVPLETLAKNAALVVKATVVAVKPAQDRWFQAQPGFAVREAELRVISVIRGPARRPEIVRFRHYAPTDSAHFYAPQHYRLKVGSTYIVFAASAQAGGDIYRQLQQAHTMKEDQGVMRVANTEPHRGTTITQVVQAELRDLLASQNPDDVLEAIHQLDALSGGRDSGLSDLPRAASLDAIRPLILAKSEAVATAAISFFGSDSPYFEDGDASFWLAGVGKGVIPGLAPREPPAHPMAERASKELVAVASGLGSPKLRALALRALGRTGAIDAAKLAAWRREDDVEVRRAAVLVSAALPDHTPLIDATRDRAPEVRHAAALAIGFSQDSALLPQLGALLADKESKVRAASALSLLSFSVEKSAAVMKANLATDWKPLFVNALARKDPAPYLPLLAEIIEKQLSPADFWGGAIPAGDSWTLLWSYVKDRPAAEIAAGKLDASLDALERMKWFSSSEPRKLYALYLARGLKARAKRFRDAVRKSESYNIDYYFDMADKDPSTYLH